MPPVKGRRDKSRMIVFTITIKVKELVDVKAALDTASINL